MSTQARRRGVIKAMQLLCLGLAVLAGPAYAACRPGMPPEYRYPYLHTLDPGEITIDLATFRNMLPGSLLLAPDQLFVTQNYPARMFACDSGLIRALVRRDMVLAPSGYSYLGKPIFKSHVEGIGIQVATGFVLDTNIFPYAKTYNTNVSLGLFGGVGSDDLTLDIRLFKIGDHLGVGNLVNGPYGRMWLDGYPGTNLVDYYVRGSIKIANPTCKVSVDSQSIAVTLPDIRADQLSTVSSTAGERPFAIRLECSQSFFGRHRAKHFLTFDADSDLPTIGVIKPTLGAGQAAGVGVQLLKGNCATPVELRRAEFVADYPDRPGTIPIPYCARYYRTDRQVAPGEVRATATFTLNYQ